MEIFHNFILRMLGLAIVDSFVGCRFRNMTISHGISKNRLTLYPPAKQFLAHETPMLAENKDSDDDNI
jgi:hypothetical protein